MWQCSYCGREFEKGYGYIGWTVYPDGTRSHPVAVCVYDEGFCVDVAAMQAKRRGGHYQDRHPMEGDKMSPDGNIIPARDGRGKPWRS